MSYHYADWNSGNVTQYYEISEISMRLKLI